MVDLSCGLAQSSLTGGKGCVEIAFVEGHDQRLAMRASCNGIL